MLVSALIAEGPPSRLLEEAIAGRIELVLPDLALDELQRVLSGKLGFDGEQARAAVDLLTRLAGERPGPPGHLDAITVDDADNVILASAVEAGVEVLATGDRTHLLPIGEHRGVKLLTPQAVLAELRSHDRGSPGSGAG